MSSDAVAGLADDLEPLLDELKSCRDSVRTGFDVHAYKSVRRRIAARLRASGLEREAREFDPPALAYGSAEPRGISVGRFVQKLENLVSEMRTHPDGWTMQLDQGQKQNLLRPAGKQDYIAPSRIEALKALNASSSWDLKRLIRLCEEINIAHQNDSFLSVAMLVRALMDHVPPLFGAKSFEQVASSADRSVKDLLVALQSAKPIGDRALHVQIARRVPLPTEQQVDLKHHVDVLLEYVIGQLQ